MESIGVFFALPIMLLNFLGGIVGGIGLIVQGDWTKFFLGIAYAFTGGFIVSIMMLPSMIFCRFPFGLAIASTWYLRF